MTPRYYSTVAAILWCTTAALLLGVVLEQLCEWLGFWPN